MSGAPPQVTVTNSPVGTQINTLPSSNPAGTSDTVAFPFQGVAGGVPVAVQSGSVVTGQASLTVGSSTGSVALGSAGPVVQVYNPGSAVVYVKLGSSSVTAASTDTPVAPGSYLILNTGNVATYIAAIAPTGTPTLTITTGTGTPLGWGGAGGGGAGGAVNIGQSSTVGDTVVSGGATAVAIAASGGSSSHSYVPTNTITLNDGGSPNAVVTVSNTQVVSAIINAAGSGVTVGATAAALVGKGTGYIPTDVIALSDGAAVTNGALTVTATQVVTATINAAGSSGTTGAATISSIAAAGTVYVPGDTITLNDSAAVTHGVIKVSTTGVVSATIAAAGTFTGSTGTYTVLGTTGTGTKFQASCTLTNGSGLTAVLSIAVAGSYSVNPISLTTEPVYAVNLSGAQLDVVMGVATATITTAGAVASTPSNPVAQTSSSGSGTGATFNLTYSPVTITGTTGTGTKFQATGLLVSGALSGSLTVTVGGVYTVNPTSLSAEPVTGGGLVGATITVVMGVQAVSILTAGAVGSIPSNPVAQLSSSGAGSGATFTMTYPSSITITGTTGAGTKFQATGGISSGGLSGALTVSVAGNYTTNPTSLTAEPVTSSGLTGATVTLVMGVLGATVSTAGLLTSLPSNPVAQLSTSGSGLGATFNMTYSPAVQTLFGSTVPTDGWKINNPSLTADIWATDNGSTPVVNGADSIRIPLGGGGQYATEPAEKPGGGVVKILGGVVGQPVVARRW